MASEVEICNLALAHLGDSATVASIDPPEGSAQAEHCARFYPIARNALLEMHAWGFSTKRATLALIASGWPEWDYAYAYPSDALNILAVISPTATDDYSVDGVIPTQPFSCEVNESNQQIIYTDQANAVLRYTALVSDTTRFSPLFVTTLSHYLASMLAGPIIKGDIGANESKRQLSIVQSFLAQAKTSDANQRKTNQQHVPSSVAARY